MFLFVYPFFVSPEMFSPVGSLLRWMCSDAEGFVLLHDGFTSQNV